MVITPAAADHPQPQTPCPMEFKIDYGEEDVLALAYIDCLQKSLMCSDSNHQYKLESDMKSEPLKTLSTTAEYIVQILLVSLFKDKKDEQDLELVVKSMVQGFQYLSKRWGFQIGVAIGGTLTAIVMGALLGRTERLREIANEGFETPFAKKFIGYFLEEYRHLVTETECNALGSFSLVELPKDLNEFT